MLVVIGGFAGFGFVGLLFLVLLDFFIVFGWRGELALLVDGSHVVSGLLRVVVRGGEGERRKGGGREESL